MRYVALLRGINVGGNNKVSMVELKAQFVMLGFTDVRTYINSGNVIFSSSREPSAKKVCNTLIQHFGVPIDLLILNAEAVSQIANAIPSDWVNDDTYKADVCYLFNAVNTPDICEQIGYRADIETFIYVNHAVLMRISRSNQQKGSLLKIVGSPLYKQMTIRNVNTARKLAEMCQ